ncbi:cytochrome c1 [Hyphomicrobium facile]|uniref:Cytochrome c1 n=1 Tax=Hyphomicrobium facile TaxID=51670 RepID=A0A1I7MYF2_9HYPH|nr:cytochrome c1 [Hyphomicrobium facile]SFV27434.1 Cytochrome c1 [Hyphomicrobium facile]
MKKHLSLTLLSMVAATVAMGSLSAEEAGHQEIERQKWSFSGFTGQFDKAQLQRGFQVYKEVCAACHGLKRVAFRNLVQPGGPEFPEDAVKELAATWPNQITDGPNDEGKMFERPPLLSDPIRGPYHNDNEARASQNGALPPDLSLIARARDSHREASWYIHPFLMLGDILNAYQEGGANYIYALLTEYSDAPADYKLTDGKYYNKAFPGHQIAMPPPLSDGVVAYQDGTPSTVDHYSHDVVAFLSWAADPSLDQRKRIGWQVILYLIVTTGLLYLGKKRIWKNIKH